MSKKSVRSVEKKINNTLYFISFFLTIIVMIMNVIEFLSRGRFPPARMDFFYIGILAIYALHKETVRWFIEKDEEWTQKKGEYFFYLWVLITTAFFTINFFSKDYFSFSPSGEPINTITKTAFTTLEVGVVFIVARFLKIATAKTFLK